LLADVVGLHHRWLDASMHIVQLFASRLFPCLTFASVNSRATLKALKPLLLKYQVDAVFAGHVHSYERTHQVQGACYFDRECVLVVTLLPHVSVLEANIPYVCSNNVPLYYYPLSSDGCLYKLF
jgi:hypothetical protein